jgi:hypothetical protein
MGATVASYLYYSSIYYLESYHVHHPRVKALHVNSDHGELARAG